MAALLDRLAASRASQRRSARCGIDPVEPRVRALAHVGLASAAEGREHHARRDGQPAGHVRTLPPRPRKTGASSDSAHVRPCGFSETSPVVAVRTACAGRNDDGQDDVRTSHGHRHVGNLVPSSRAQRESASPARRPPAGEPVAAPFASQLRSHVGASPRRCCRHPRAHTAGDGPSFARPSRSWKLPMQDIATTARGRSPLRLVRGARV